ncbi:hypothetical protein F5Y16DRAFT_391573 [Xylariaceae sp. FL0255]|nr:hypothetical protein F5Y16DRAFT_391573 [Xylariaceae sp. FL0255]
MDIAKYAVGPQSYDILSRAQISTFFASNASVTRNECDDLAAELLGGPVNATPIQGGNSYTVEREEAGKVVQFRSSQLDMAKFGLAQQVYSDFIPRSIYQGPLGSLHIYVCDRVSGTAFCRVRQQMFNSETGLDKRLRQTVQDLAKFFALAWNNRQALEIPLGLQNEYIATLDKLSLILPDTLRPTIDTVKQNLHILFRPDFPIAVQHGDILENNIHVEESSGHITGVVDWHDAFIAPFGLSLGGMEIFLGAQTHKNWYLHPFHLDLRRHFWDTFYTIIGQVSELDQRSIEVGRLMGLLQAHGFESNGMSGIYLERLVLF